MIVGIPRALLYYKNEKLWTKFFDELGIDYIISPETNKEIIENGSKYAIDETCLPIKIFLGHIDYLKDKCDYVFIPRIESAQDVETCLNFRAQYDLIKNTFRKYDLKLLFYNEVGHKKHKEYKAFKKLCKYLKVKKSLGKYAYQMAKQTQLYYELFRSEYQENILKNSKKTKVLILAHAYNIGDKYVGEPIINMLKKLDAEPIIAEYFDAKRCVKESLKVSKTLPWSYNRHLLGALELYKDVVDGVILITTYPCGPDSMCDEMIVRHYKDIPILTLTIDAQDATAGIETRIESFIDILNYKRKNNYEQ